MTLQMAIAAAAPAMVETDVLLVQKYVYVWALELSCCGMLCSELFCAGSTIRIRIKSVKGQVMQGVIQCKWK